MKIVKYEEFSDIYAFEKALNVREVNTLFKNNQSSITGSMDFTGTKDWNEAQSLLNNGWAPKVEKIKNELKKFSIQVERDRNKIIKSIAGFAPCVPNAIRGVPKSMLAVKTVPKKQRVVKLVINNTIKWSISSEKLMESGVLFLKLALLLEKCGIKTEILIVPKLSEVNCKVYGCSVKIKDYKQPFNISKMAYPIAHTSLFRRHGFRWWEVIDSPLPSEATEYGCSLVYLNDYEKKEVLHKLNFDAKDTIYLDFNDAVGADFNVENLIKNKGIKIK